MKWVTRTEARVLLPFMGEMTSRIWGFMISPPLLSVLIPKTSCLSISETSVSRSHVHFILFCFGFGFGCWFIFYIPQYAGTPPGSVLGCSPSSALDTIHCQGSNSGPLHAKSDQTVEPSLWRESGSKTPSATQEFFLSVMR